LPLQDDFLEAFAQVEVREVRKDTADQRSSLAQLLEDAYHDSRRRQLPSGI
jgi:hypothetical protein